MKFKIPLCILNTNKEEIKSISPSTVVMYESLQNNPNDVISKIFSDLQLESTENLINEISRVVQRSHKKTSHSDDDAFREVLMKYNDVSNLEPYLVKE